MHHDRNSGQNHELRLYRRRAHVTRKLNIDPIEVVASAPVRWHVQHLLDVVGCVLFQIAKQVFPRNGG